MEINGLPAHFLLIHAVLVLLPLTAAGAIAASRFGAQPSLPTAAEVDAILAP